MVIELVKLEPCGHLHRVSHSVIVQELVVASDNWLSNMSWLEGTFSSSARIHERKNA
jgi:hypothetical protein